MKINSPTEDGGGLSDKIKQADNVMNMLINNKSVVEKKNIQNVTFALTRDDVKLINEQIKRYMLKEGEVITKSLLIRTALSLFSSLSDDELKEKVSLINQVDRGRPRAIK